MKVAVLGGGLTGLSATFHLARRFPNSQIFLLEKNPRLGGWIKSQRVNVKDHSVLLESGPRTLRPSAKALIELINLLSLKKDLVITQKSAPAARNRFIWIPKEYNEPRGFSGLLKLPSSLYGLLSSPLRDLILPDVLREPFKLWKGPSYTEDLSLHELLSLRFSPYFARILGSALVHGVYAADSRQLSTEAAFPAIFRLVSEGGGSIFRGALRDSWKNFIEYQKAFQTKDIVPNAFDLGGVDQLLEHQNTSVFSFKDGLETLPAALQRFLEQKSNVTIMKGSQVTKLEINNDLKSFRVLCGSSWELPAVTHVISALPTPVLQDILPSHLPQWHSPLVLDSKRFFSTVTVTNLVYELPKRDAPLHPDGFGFLIPRPPRHIPLETANPLGILGVVFDSSSLSAQDSSSVCKLTVMSGGPYKCSASQEDIVAFLSSTLGPRLSHPIHAQSTTLVDCIPHPRVGHAKLAQQLSSPRDDNDWISKRLKIIGPGVTGVSVGDCIEAGRTASSLLEPSVE